MAYEVIILYHLQMPGYYVETFTEYHFFIAFYNNGIIRQSLSDSLFGDIYETDSTISISIRQTVLPRR